MILLADSGGSGTTWILLSNHSPLIFHTQGCHPGIVKSEKLAHVFQSVFPEHRTQVKQVFFYGTGCASKPSVEKISTHLAATFEQAQITVKSDVVGAALAVLGDHTGVAGILGTGMNAAIFSQGEIVKNIVSLGFILGDEGSGVHIGKQLLKAVLSGTLSADTTRAFYEITGYNMDCPDEVIADLYAAERYNEWLGKFAKTAKELSQFADVRQIIEACFHDFTAVVKNLVGDSDITEIGLIGSVAFHFQDEIKQALATENFTLAKVLTTPTDGLIAYHSRHLSE